MGKTRGFRLGRKLVRVFKWFIWRKRSPRRYKRLNPSSCTRNAMYKLLNWGRSLQSLCFSKSDSGYIQLGRVEAESLDIPRGHLAVYVGESDEDTHRILVPVIYFNHPLFGKLLMEAEKLYGFNHPGGIQIPCGISEFENVQTRIASCGNFRRRRCGKGVYC